ncbi:MAG: hypothetical protein FIB02_03035 [Desulfuromonas sp.]|nr:hypothetical protein [Desulfuromonas sp.]
MKRFAQIFVPVLILAVLVAAPLPVLAAMHEHGGSSSMGSMDHGSMKMDDHGGMKDAATAMLGDQTVEGVKAMAHLKDVKAAMSKMGMKETHHFMVNFLGKDGKPITEGTVAVKIKSPAGKEGEAIALMGMQGHFGADVVLAEQGAYEFKVGTKLPDGTTRQYEFKYEVK